MNYFNYIAIALTLYGKINELIHLAEIGLEAERQGMTKKAFVESIILASLKADPETAPEAAKIMNVVSSIIDGIVFLGNAAGLAKSKPF